MHYVVKVEVLKVSSESAGPANGDTRRAYGASQVKTEKVVEEIARVVQRADNPEVAVGRASRMLQIACGVGESDA